MDRDVGVTEKPAITAKVNIIDSSRELRFNNLPGCNANREFGYGSAARP
jgi:hypothetical protein